MKDHKAEYRDIVQKAFFVAVEHASSAGIDLSSDFSVSMSFEKLTNNVAVRFKQGSSTLEVKQATEALSLIGLRVGRGGLEA